jgi:hypothetical protein
MPRSDDWTIHMATALIKRRAWADFPRMSRKRSNRPRFPSLCPASLIRSGQGLDRRAAGGFDAKSAARFFFAVGGADRRVALPRLVPEGQAVEMFVELNVRTRGQTRVLCCHKATGVDFLSLRASHGADALDQAGNFARRGLAMDHPFLRRARDDRLGFLQGRPGGRFIACGDRRFHLAHRASHASAPRLVRGGAADGLASGFLCRFRVGHGLILEALFGPQFGRRSAGKRQRMIGVLYSERP